MCATTSAELQKIWLSGDIHVPDLSSQPAGRKFASAHTPSSVIGWAAAVLAAAAVGALAAAPKVLVAS